MKFQIGNDIVENPIDKSISIFRPIIQASRLFNSLEKKLDTQHFFTRN